MFIRCITLLYLVSGSILDLRKRRISLRMSAVYSVLVLVTGDLGRTGLGERIPALFAGAFFAAASAVSRNAIGMGDAIVVCTLGLAYPSSRLFPVVASSIFFCGAVSLLFVLTGKLKKEDTIPYIPFLLAGDLFYTVMGGAI